MTTIPGDSTRAPQFAMPVYLVGGGGGVFPPAGMAFVGYQQLVLTGLAQALTVPGGATVAYVSAEGGNARWGTAAQSPALSASVGQVLWGTAAMSVSGSLLAAIEFINMSGSTCTLDIAYFG